MSLVTYSRSVRIARPAAAVFEWHERPGAFERLAPPWQKLHLLGRSGGIQDGATVSLRTQIGPCWVRWDVAHCDYQAGVQFRDIQQRGPFAHWEHLHRVEPVEAGRACILTDTVTYQLPFGPLGRIFGAGLARRELTRLFNYRHALTRADLESTARYIAVRPMTFLLAGASGLIGRSLSAFLQTQGHTVLRLVRRQTTAADEIFWNPAKGEINSQALRGVDVIVNLAGEGIAEGRWTDARKAALLRSRVDATRTLVDAIAAVKNERLRPFVFISASATGFYGDRGNETLDEQSPVGTGFLAEVCTAWEREALAAEPLGVRVVRLRTGVVLTPAGGALAKMLPLFAAGLGGRLGLGRRWMSWISLDDLIGAIYHAVLDRRCDGAINAVAPQPVTNREFTATLAKVLRRPALLPVPPVILCCALGEMANETLLSSTRVTPEKLQTAGYRFLHADLESALRAGLGLAEPNAMETPAPRQHQRVAEQPKTAIILPR